MATCLIICPIFKTDFLVTLTSSSELKIIVFSLRLILREKTNLMAHFR